MRNSIRLLIVEDSAEDALLIARELEFGGLEPVWERVDTAASLEAALDVRPWDLIICDYAMPQFTGPAALEIYRKKGLDIPFISISGMVGEEKVAEMLKAGAHDYVMKGNLTRLVSAVTRELKAAEERRTKRQRETTLAFLASIVESCEDAIIGTTLEGVVVTWNGGAERLYGYAAADIIGRSVSVLFPPYRPEESDDILHRIKQGQRVERLETVRLRKDGTPVEVSLTVSPIKDPAEAIIGASTVARDITERKQEENERLGLIQDLTAALAHVRP
jgi:PAS domain S-box-containing protein